MQNRPNLARTSAFRILHLAICIGMAGRLGAAPSRLSFGDSVAQAGARPKIKLERLPGVATGGGRPQGPPWRGDILLLNHNRGN
jgi:hypothetical protein